MDEYESVCAAIAMIDAAHDALQDIGESPTDDVRDELHRQRNNLNEFRLGMLKSAAIGKYGVDWT